MFSQQAKVCTVVPGDLFHILTKGRRYFVLSLFISIAHCLLWSNILIAVRIYTERTNILSRSKLACTAIKLSASHCATTIELYIYKQVTVRLCQKEPLLLALVLDQTFIYVKGHVPILDLAIVQVSPIVPAIVRVYQSIKPSHCAGIFKQ